VNENEKKKKYGMEGYSYGSMQEMSKMLEQTPFTKKTHTEICEPETLSERRRKKKRRKRRKRKKGKQGAAVQKPKEDSCGRLNTCVVGNK